MIQDDLHQPLNGRAWTNVDVQGRLPEPGVRIQDDFHAAVNLDWISKAVIEPGNSSESSFWERMREVESQVKSILEDPSLPDAGPEGALAQGLYRELLDMGRRNELGFQAVMPYVDRIRAVQTLDDMTALLSDDAYLFTATLCSYGAFADKKDSLNNVVYVGCDSFSLSDADEYRDMTPQGERMKAANEGYFAWLLCKAGYGAEEAKKAVSLAFGFEKSVAVHCFGVSAQARDDFSEITYNARTADELAEEAGCFPVMQVLRSAGLSPSCKFVLEEPEWLQAMARLYSEENLDAMKHLMCIRTLRRFAGYLGQDAYDRRAQWNAERMGSEGSKPLDRDAYETVNGLLGMAVGRLYVGRFLASDTKADVEALIERVVATYRERLAAAEWLSVQTREKALEKMGSLIVRVGYPSSWPDYSTLKVPSGASLVDWVICIQRFEYQREAMKVNKPVDREEWLMPPHIVNAYYLPTDNSINILAGILGGVFYDPKAPVEQNMGGIGMVIGHEITHAFDKNGSLYDKDGNLGESWWTDEDRAEFKKRTDRAARYWNNIEVLPGMNVDGDLCAGEIVADLGGLSCMVHIARSMEGFDFARMFRAYARNWRCVGSLQRAEFLLTNDVHPPAHLRTNATVQMVPEFYDCFDVRPGDGMYLDPEDRLSVW